MAEGRKQSIWTAANVVTVIRICFIPVFLVALLGEWPTWFPALGFAAVAKPWIAMVLFALLAATDSVDGYLARSRNEVTTFGKFMDPLADKILVAAALLALVELSVIPAWPVMVILAREFIVSGVRMLAAAEGEVIAASWYGKVKTVTQIIAILLFLLKYSLDTSHIHQDFTNPLYVLSWIVMIVALVMTILSMVDYVWKARGLFTKSAEHDQAGRADVQHEGIDARSSRCAELQQSIDNLAHDLVVKAQARSCKLATAESLTGGMIGTAITGVPGSSAVFMGGIMSYDNQAKMDLLGVQEGTLAAHGAVSEQTALQMATGARAALKTDYAVSVTGIAGPGGAVPGKPVGTVWFGLAGPIDAVAETRCFEGDREEVRLQTVEHALKLLLAACESKVIEG